MKKTCKTLFIGSLFLASTLSPAWANEETKVREHILAQAKECASNAAMEWNASVNRCVLKKQSHESRSASEDCAKLESQAAREQCHMKLAEKETGFNVGDINKGNTGKSMLINTAGAALSAINLFAKGEEKNSCTSAKILAVTSIAGLASDLFLRNKANKKVKELEDKYQLDQISSAHEAQVSAFEYLKEEQITVKEIASLEKKRNMLLIAGYGVATAYAAYEMYSKMGTCAPGTGGAADKAAKAGSSGTTMLGGAALAGGAVVGQTGKGESSSAPATDSAEKGKK